MAKVERAVRPQFGKQLQKFRAVNIVAFRACRGLDPLKQQRSVGMEGNPGTNLAQFAGLFKDGDVQSTRPQGESSCQATNPAANDGDLKLLRHHLVLSQGYSTYESSVWSSVLELVVFG